MVLHHSCSTNTVAIHPLHPCHDINTDTATRVSGGGGGVGADGDCFNEVRYYTEVLHGESSKRLATPRNTKDKKHLQSTQSVQPANRTDQAPSTTEKTARETHNVPAWCVVCGVHPPAPTASVLAHFRLPAWSSVHAWLLRLRTGSDVAPARLPAPDPVMHMSAPVRRGAVADARLGLGVMSDLGFCLS